MFSFGEKMTISGIALFVLVLWWMCVASLNEKMIASCVAGGHSEEYCTFQVMR